MTTEERLSRLEHDCRRLRRKVTAMQSALGAVGIVALSALLLGEAVGQPQAPPVDWDAAGTESVLPPVAEVIRAHRFEVVGKDERKYIAAMGTTPEGHGFVETWTGSDKRTVRLGGSADGAAQLTLSDATGQQFLHLGRSQHGGGELTIFGKTQHRIAHLVSDERGDLSLRLGNHAGYDFLAIDTDAASSPQVSVYDGGGHRMLALSKSDRSAAQLELFNEIGARTLNAAVDERRAMQLQAGDAEGLVIATWPPVPPVEDRGDLPPVPPHLQQKEPAAAPATPPAP
ncbi:MAG TPA: hypothetical protein VEC57_08210 [Candidatus Limnocylindrales bacterium]|nr:hypothetical protein [Candidatus Limnocylindrales bacterium]